MSDSTTEADLTSAPDGRHPLIAWCDENRVQLAKAAADLSITYNSLRRYCLPFENAQHQTPRSAVVARIVAYTNGRVTAEDFFPPHLTRAGQGGEVTQ
jgi:hypothetical protein